MRPHAFAKPVKTAIAGLLLFAALAGPARAIVKFNDGHDEIFITGTAGITYDSNIYADANAQSDTIFTESLALEYQRKAGILGVNANLGWNFGQFASNTSESYADPYARAEITKGTGRTTGSLTLGAQRQSRTEYALNLRTVSWDYDTGLNVKYPVIERYSISGQLAYNYQDYVNNPNLFDIRTATAGADLFYVYTSQRDILGGYRLRITDTTNSTRSYDHAFTLGTTGKLLPKLNGTVRLGYQFRQTDRNNLGRNDETFSAFTTATSATWTVSKRFTVTGIASRDFTTLATDINVDNTAAALSTSFATTGRIALFGGGGGGHLRYLGSLSDGRRDTYATANLGFAYTLNDHLKITFTGLWYKNWSKLDQADFIRRTISLLVTSRW
ncbi:MAG: outer membrane beta-barrel protein [Nibricoccus sp.]